MNQRPSTEIYLALGTNLGDRRENLSHAIRELKSFVNIRDLSPIYETEPWGYEDQQDFLNQVIRAGTSLSPGELLEKLKEVEKQLGREKTFRNGPRVIDLDILYYGKSVVSQQDLKIPHPRIPERAFVLVPLADLNPDWVSPDTGLTAAEMLDRVDSSGVQLYQD